MAELLKVDNLSAGYGEAVVLHDVSVRIQEGETLALLGRNGTGKTTFAHEFLPNEADCPVFVNADLIAAGRENFHRHYAPCVDAWMLYDNGGLSPSLLDWSE